MDSMIIYEFSHFLPKFRNMHLNGINHYASSFLTYYLILECEDDELEEESDLLAFYAESKELEDSLTSYFFT